MPVTISGTTGLQVPGLTNSGTETAARFVGSTGTFSSDVTAIGNIFGGTAINIQSGTTYTIRPGDNGTMIASTNSTTGLTASVVSSLTYPAGFSVGIIQLGSAQITLQGSGTTIYQSNSAFKTARQYSAAALAYTGITPGWVAFGDLAT